MITFQTYNTLPDAAAQIRRAVFTQEQGFTEEFDDIDQTAYHLVLFLDEIPMATCRLYQSQASSCYLVGRLAVLSSGRGQHLVAALLKQAEQVAQSLGGCCIALAAQVQAKGFYEKQGYLAHGALFYEEGVPHIWMEKQLSSPVPTIE